MQVQSWLQASNNTGIFSTYTRLLLTESEQETPVDWIKDAVQSPVSSQVRQEMPKEGLGTYRPKQECNNKDEDNSPKTLKVKNHQTSSQKFRQIIIIISSSSSIYYYYHYYDLKYVKTPSWLFYFFFKFCCRLTFWTS